MLSVVALPIGNLGDITLRALRLLNEAEVIIGEERRELMPLLKHLEVDNQSKQIEFLNEHSEKQEISQLMEICRTKNTVLVSDCGTPVFCDPGAHLIQQCRANGIQVVSAPGASSLMTLLSLSSKKLSSFYFKGFLPREKTERIAELQKLAQRNESFVVMDTPYRLKATLEQMTQIMPKRKALLGCDLTQESELVVEGSISQLNSKIKDGEKKEFILLVY